jgi:hypothetical protein
MSPAALPPPDRAAGRSAEPLPRPPAVAIPLGLFARKGEAVPAADPPRSTPPGPAPRPVPARAVARPSPLAFLIDRRIAPEPAAASPAAASPAPASVAGPASRPAPGPVAPAPARPAAAVRRPLTVRLHPADFDRLKALAVADAATYQSLIETAVRRLLAAAAHAAAAADAAIPTAPRRRHR